MTTVSSGKYTYILEENWAHLPEGMTMGNASAVATDSQDRVYVFQRKDPPVLIFGPGGNYLGAWGIRAIDEAHGIYIQDDIVYITDRTDSVCVIFTLDGKPLQVIGDRGVHSDTGCEIPGEVCPRAAGPFNYPTEIVPAPNGDLYVSDGYRNAPGAPLLPGRAAETVLGRAGQGRARRVSLAPQHRGAPQRQPVPVRPGEQSDAGLYS